MADSYAHSYVARQALGEIPVVESAFYMGANGPDPLFFYRAWQKNAKPFARFGNLMHQKKTGEFLKKLYEYCDNEAQKSYFLGFLCHYGLDCTIHPWVKYQENTVYTMAEGHGFLESSLDDYVYHQMEGKKGKLPLGDYAPKLRKDDSQAVGSQVSKAILQVYGQEISAQQWETAMADLRLCKQLLRGKPGLFSKVEKLCGIAPGFLLSHIQPPVMSLDTGDTWENPFTGEEYQETIQELLERAIATCRRYLEYGVDLLQNPDRIGEFDEIIGSKNYETGISSEAYK